MCAVSMISDYYNDKNWDYRGRQEPSPFQQQGLSPFQHMAWPHTVPPSLPWNQDSFKLLQEIMEKMKTLDEKLGLANCEDPNKAEWMKSIEERLKALEAK